MGSLLRQENTCNECPFRAFSGYLADIRFFEMVFVVFNGLFARFGIVRFAAREFL